MMLHHQARVRAGLLPCGNRQCKLRQNLPSRLPHVAVLGRAHPCVCLQAELSLLWPSLLLPMGHGAFPDILTPLTECHC